MSAAATYRRVKVGGCLAAEHRVDATGVQRLRSLEPLQPYPARLTDRLEEWARHAPERVQVAQRGADGEWRKISYAQMLERVRRVGQALAALGLSADRPIAILSDNDLEHYTLALAAQWVGVPYTPVSVAYSTVSQDFGKLRQILGALAPGLVFAADGHAFRNAIATVVPADVEVWVTRGEDTPALQGRKVRRFDEVLATAPGP
jgi:feruloyl-CoA synthase